MEKLCDLHTHSLYSDGTCTTGQLIEIAREAGLSAIVLSDHNTVAGLPSFIEAAEGSGVEAVPGVEFSTEYQGKELHILGMYIREESYPQINEILEQFLQRKEKSNRELVERLAQAGVVLDYDKIKEQSAGSINRAVIGAEMVEKGYCESVKKAFSHWLSPKQGYYIPPLRPDAFETIRFIKSIGAVAVLAHPFLSLDEQELEVFLQTAVPAGLDGMEVYYSLFSPGETEKACRIADSFGLLYSGGSDFHGKNKPDIAMGTGKGNLKIPLSWLEKLRTRQRV